MGAIEDIYADLDADVTEEEFREAVEAKVEQMGGLADEETAAMLIAHELDENEVNAVADVEPGMSEVQFLAKVMAVGELRTFDRDGEEDAEGRVINVEAADESGAVRLAFWDERAQAVANGEIAVGDVLRVQGRPKEGYNGLEVSVDRAEVDEDTEIDVEPGDGSTIDALTLGQSDVTVRGHVLDTDSVRTFDRDDGTEGRVANLTIGDETGRVRVTLWDEQADRADEIDTGTAVEVVDGYVREREGQLELHVGDQGAVDEVDEPVAYEPDAEPIDAVEIGDTVDVAGVVRSADPKRTFDRDDGTEGQVRNVRIQDDTGDIRVALWGDKADLDVAPGDEVLVADVEIQDGWQDDKEASANWASAIVVLEDGADESAARDGAVRKSAGGDASGGGVDTADSAALSSFATEGGESSAESNTDGDARTGTDATDDAAAGVEEAAAAAAVAGPDEGDDAVEFTGTVVQTGDPIVLDDGEQTMTVESDEAIQLGQEVTARGPVRDGRLEAEDLF